MAFEQVHAPAAREPVDETQCRREVRCGLAVCAQPGRAVGGDRRVGQDAAAVAHDARVVGHPGRVDRLATLDQRGEGPPVQREGEVGRQGLLDAGACDLVPEPHRLAVGLEHPGGEALLEAGERQRGDGLEQPQLRPCRHHGDRLEQTSRQRRQPRGPGQDGIANGVGGTVRAGGQHLGDEEWVATREPVQLLRVDGLTPREEGDPGRRERRKAHPMHASPGGQLAEQDPERVRARQLVVAVRREHQRRHAAQPPGQHAQQVEGRLVGPVQVLEDQHHRLADGLRQGVDDVAGTCAPLHQGRQVAAELGGEVEERTVGTRRTQVFGPADHDTYGAARGELVDE